MIRQSLKDVYFIANRWLALPSCWLVGFRYRSVQQLVLHLGCGDDYRDGMINVDGNFFRKKDLWLDLRNRLPFANGSARLIYCCHMLEHLYPYEATYLLSEMLRVLSDDGVIRLAVPSFERCLEIVAGRSKSTWPHEFEHPASQAINYLLCDGQHKYAYCFENLREMSQDAGFEFVHHYSAEHGVAPKRYDGITLGDEPPGSLVVELGRRNPTCAEISCGTSQFVEGNRS